MKDDLISRQAAIDAECEVCQIAPKKERGHNCTYYVHGCKEIECLRALPSAEPEQVRTQMYSADCISRQAAIDAVRKHCEKYQTYPIAEYDVEIILNQLPSAQPEQEDYTEMKREFLRMASYIDSLLVCPDEQKETLMNFVSRIAEFMPWTERD